MDANLIQKITIYAIPLIFAITLHEAAHAYAAKHFGDATAYMLGRMTLNPIKHIDPIWTIAIPLMLILVGSPFVFGAAKPVPVNFAGLRNPKRDMIWVAAAGPLANLAMMIFWAIVGKMATGLPESDPAVFLALVAQAGIFVNALLMVFNLFPLPPLDGGRIVTGLLPGPLAYKFARIEPYGMFILIGLIVLRVMDFFLWPLVALSMKTIYGIIGLSS
ncbi:MAG: site-2 protease family protein [Betaproteobacteria bacterium]|nr:site-2 protease family protein [Betaproteobacteria bacterium]